MKKILAIATLTILSVSMPMHAAASDGVPRADAGRFYLSAICPVNAAWDNLDESWKAAGLPKRVRYGTPLPKTVLASYKRIAKASGRAGVALNKYNNWPAAVSLRDVNIMVDAFYKDSTKAYNIFEAGAFKRSQGDWANGQGASQRIRKALNLPPRPQGCPND